MIRVLHAAQMRTTNAGVVHQMEYEDEAAADIGIYWDSRLFCLSESGSKVVVNPLGRGSSWYTFRKQFFRWLSSEIKGYDILLLRYSMYDPFQLLFLRNCPIPVVTMHHTLDVEELLISKSASGYAKAVFESLIGPVSLRYVHGVAAVTGEIARYQRDRSARQDMSTFHYPNGAVYNKNSVIEARYESDTHEFIYLSSRFYPWMGLDLLIEASARSNRVYKIHIVGNVTADQKEALAHDQRFVVHGHLEKAQIESLMSVSTVGLSTFAIERKRFTEGNTLKVMEYLKSGLPVYAGYKDVFDNSFPYYRQGPADMNLILEFADSVRKVSRHVISDSARPIIDKSIVLKRFYNQLLKKFDDSVSA